MIQLLNTILVYPYSTGEQSGIAFIKHSRTSSVLALVIHPIRTLYTRYNILIGRILSTNMKLVLKNFMTVTESRTLYSA